MFKHLDDDEQILDFLTDVDLRFTDFDADRVTSFHVITDYHLLLFSSKEGDKGFHLFTVDNVKRNLQDLKSLMVYLSNLYGLTQLALIKEAISQVDIEIASVTAVQIFESCKK
ncbi:MAG: hypothetical protein EOP04_03385 [Proteobacteria bacterium]|nr:MAG: hypothetical protein EOP04_03385 [Pseudomonadota bacterium]